MKNNRTCIQNMHPVETNSRAGLKNNRTCIKNYGAGLKNMLPRHGE